MFDLSPSKLLILVVIAIVVFGPHELPKIASQAGKALRELRRIAEGAKTDLREGLGPEFQDFDFDDLNPKTFVRKHLMDDGPVPSHPLMDDVSGGATAALGGATVTGVAAGPVLLDGEEPPFDTDAT